ncbi:hypothetical protein [Methylobacter sp. S3L5C]|uniref:hypothetical protein n=1 Tax=Methylobacter sp. S3L5C TaxID=2839024 RepID=UPI001FADA250|nr:hypothetical protein [Methylobacter sp. S3L5C]UOA08628.1 hypothetical protein KKZ03_20965 [Methylobacter sp. S3L5C]
MKKRQQIETEQILHALEGAAQGIAAAVEQETITSMQIYCLLNILIKQLQANLSH